MSEEDYFEDFGEVVEEEAIESIGKKKGKKSKKSDALGAELEDLSLGVTTTKVQYVP